jgi:putative tryptophan/tyrosine transport system substrate-binding protein
MQYKFIFLLLIFVLLFYSCLSKPSESNNKIAIFQHIQHPALDSIKNNIVEYLKNEYPDYHISEYNSQGDITTGVSVINKINMNNYKLVIAIATPSAQLAANYINNIPIVFTAVTDPVAAGLVENLEHPGKNITGVSDSIDSKQQIEFIKDVNPDIKKIGIIYNTSDINSEIAISNLKSDAKNENIEIITGGILSVHEVNEAALVIVPKVDAILMIFDNTVASGFSSLLNVCKRFNKPIYVLDKTYVELGATAGLSIDYKYLAYLTFKITEKIINGVQAGDISVKTIDKYEIYHN